jgi:predicted Fe-Mo cluster-binding NifX family protein
MRIGISTDGNYVSDHFGRCPSFTIVDVENGVEIKRAIINNPGHQPGLIPEFLQQKGVECIIAGGMGRRAEGLFAQAGIRVIVGVTGTVDDVIDRIMRGVLEGGESLCKPGAGKGYGIEKNECTDTENEKDHP